jgi:hypothetical protein
MNLIFFFFLSFLKLDFHRHHVNCLQVLQYYFEFIKLKSCHDFMYLYCT